jgi:hypothetical protein
MAITHYPLLTVADAIDHTLDAVLAGDASPRSRRMATRAVFLPAVHHRHGRPADDRQCGLYGL